jgi:nitrite reductase (NADH) small subunit
MNTFQPLCRLYDLPDHQGKTFAVAGKLIALFRCGDQVHAIDDMCPHMGASLAAGHVEDGIVTCPWHAWRFRLDDGAWADNPRIQIGHYPVRIVGDEVHIQLPTPPQEGTS